MALTGITQTTLALEIGLSQAYISDVARATRLGPGSDRRIASCCGVILSGGGIISVKPSASGVARAAGEKP
jgi:hypothetical protein